MDAVAIISTYGFPIFMCLWFMFRSEKIINSNTEAIKKNTEVTQQLSTKIFFENRKNN